MAELSLAVSEAIPDAEPKPREAAAVATLLSGLTSDDDGDPESKRGDALLADAFAPAGIRPGLPRACSGRRRRRRLHQ